MNGIKLLKTKHSYLDSIKVYRNKKSSQNQELQVYQDIFL